MQKRTTLLKPACSGLSLVNSTKADNLSYANSTLQLTANGVPIGNSVTISRTGSGEVVKGDKGDTGAKGDTGIKGDKGDKGDLGKSAFQSAQDGGYTGTEQEYNTVFADIGNINTALNAILGV